MGEELSDERIVEVLNGSYPKGRNPAVSTLYGSIVHHDRENNLFSMQFMGDDSTSNGKPGKSAQVQGGFASAMLDAVCANGVVFFSRFEKTVATLEQKCSFIRAVPSTFSPRLGASLSFSHAPLNTANVEVIAEAKLIKMGRTIAFLEATLYRKDDEAKTPLVTCTQTNALMDLSTKRKSKM